MAQSPSMERIAAASHLPPQRLSAVGSYRPVRGVMAQAFAGVLRESRRLNDPCGKGTLAGPSGSEDVVRWAEDV
jgi:hypothetical protein